MNNEIYYVINTMTLLFGGAMALLGAGGFALYQSGLARAHASSSICLMALGGAAVAILSFYVIGCNLMYGHIGLFFRLPLTNDAFSPQSLWFFRASAAAFAASIVGGTLSERIRVWPFFVFIGIFAAIIYPIAGGWSWGGGWLSRFGFHDVAGAAVINLTAGCAAFAGTKVLGPRAGRYAPDGKPIPFPGSNIPLAVLGTMLIFFGWFGLAAGGAVMEGASAYGISKAFMSLLLGAAGGAVAAIWATRLRYGRPDITIVLNGLVAGLVSVSGAPDLYTPFEAALIGAIGGALCANLVPLLDKRKIDDPSGVIPVHLAGGAWGTLAVIFATGFMGAVHQVAGLATIGAFSFAAAWFAWGILKRTMGIRCGERSERHGLDMYELGLEAYPDFPVRTAGRPDITYIDKY